MKRLTIVSGVVVAVLFVTAAILWQVANSRTFQFFGEITARVETDEKIVALTFDDAPTEYTPDVLGILREHDVHATFYVIGSNVAERPDVARAIVADGHELGNHTYSHTRMIGPNETPGFVRDEVDQTNDLIEQVGYTGEITFRPPYGKKLFVLPWHLARNGIRTVMWDVEPDTEHAGDAGGIVADVLETTRPGSIVLMHPFCGDGCQADRAALPRIIDGLRSQGYRFVTISELLSQR